jgi:hypothetical protein
MSRTLRGPALTHRKRRVRAHRDRSHWRAINGVRLRTLDTEVQSALARVKE